jgi:cyclopropane-fatty-acyl-phospholipid synthase
MNDAATETIGASKAAIQHHYDVGNDFYRLWLDAETLSYTCALFDDAADATGDLGAAQARKLDHHGRAARVPRGGRVLDVGCGWGNGLRHFAGSFGVAQAIGLTLSAEQAAYVAGLADPRLSVRLESWADHEPEAPYDAIVSIEAFEAFARPGQTSAEKIRGYGRFFDRCRGWLKPGGQLSLQTIAYGNSAPEDFDAFISAEIFPESDLPRLAEIAEAIERRFEVVALQNDRAHYTRTLRAWLARLRAARPQAVALVGEDTTLRYERYLHLCAYMFQIGACDLHRITLRRIDQPRPRRRAPDPGATAPDPEA